MTKSARKTVILTIAVVVVVLVLLTFAFPTMVFAAKVAILFVTLFIAILVLRSAFPKRKSRD
jgi:L-asparagine transporter-like permease